MYSFSTILDSGPAQNRPRLGWFQNGVRESLRLARRQDQHAPPLEGAFGGRLGAVNDEIGHGAAFHVIGFTAVASSYCTVPVRASEICRTYTTSPQH